MASKSTNAKALFIPFLVSLILFIILTFVIVPAWRRYRARYAQYLPVNSFSEHTSSLRSRISAPLRHINISWRFGRGNPGDGGVVFNGARGSVDSAAALEEGEELDEVDVAMLRAIQRHTQGSGEDSERRLSRDLEEGFRDDSDEEHDR